MKAIIKGTDKEVNVTYNAELGLYVDDDKPYIKYLKEDIISDNFDVLQRERMVKDIMQNFDFDRVQKAMKALNWVYWYSNGKTPTIEMIKNVALECLNKVKYATEHASCATGGFNARYDSNQNRLSIVFEVEEYNISTEEIDL